MKSIGSVLLMSFFLLFPLTATAQPYLVDEPPLNTQFSWDSKPNGLILVSYDTDGNGKADFHALRRILLSHFSSLTFEEESRNFPARHVFFVPYDHDNFYYIVEKQPLFYAIDVDEDGHWDIMYQDLSADGVNGNETYFDSPSGMFPQCNSHCR